MPLLVQAQTAGQDAVLQQVEVSAQKTDDTTGTYNVGRTRSATPLDMSLRDTPQSVTVITQQRIQDQFLQNVTDVINNVAGVSVNQYETHRGGFTSRGFDIDNLQIDGVPTTWQQQWSGGETLSSLATYDRVEVVRGSTGLMTGAGNPSASINLVRKRATSKVLTGSADVSVGSWSDRRGLVDVSTPLTKSGNVRARVVGEIHKADSYVNSLKTDDNTIYATVEADLTPSTLVSVGFSRQTTDPNGPMWGGLPFWYSDGTQTNWDVSKTSTANWTKWETSYNNAFANLEHTFDNGWKLRASYTDSVRKSDSALLYLSGTPDRVTGLGMFAFSGAYVTETKQQDAGIQLNGSFNLGGRKHEAAFGYTHSKQKFNSNSRAADFGTADSSVGNFNNWNPAAYPTPTWGPETFYERSETTQDGLYGVGRFSLADPLKLIVGARVAKYEKSGTGLYTAAYNIKHDNEVTPYAGLVYDINSTFSAYGSYTEIFQPQNYKDLAGNYLDPIEGKNKEIGIKGEFLDGRVNASFALFKISQDKLAQAAGNVLRPGSTLPEAYYRAADGATSEGFDLEVTGEVARGWNASASYTHYSAKDADGLPFNSIYPRDLFRVFTTYDLSGPLAGVTVGGGINWEGKTYTTDPAAPAGNTTNNQILQDSFAMVNLMARYEINKNWSAQLNVDNLTDKKHLAMFAAYNQITYGAPRRVTAALKYRF
ncbi:TonB-dependent siderophore receptor [Duganella sp. FT27W]|nr:TonB-dependent siderophore receptor [Duganella sp. FT27W]